MNALLAAENVSFAYPDRAVLQSVGFSAERGEFLVLMGVNGAGKSTLLEILAGLRAPAAGSIRIEGRELAAWPPRERARRIGHLPQGTPHEFPFTVEQMVLMGRYAHAGQWFESEEDHRCAWEAMRRMDCLTLRARRYATLSGGERQRVLLAACIAQRPGILLFDEPATYLNVHQQIECFSLLAELAREGALCLAVTHDLNLALAHCTRLLILHEGRLAADFNPQGATAQPDWLGWLSPRLRMLHTPEGQPWVLYR